LLPGPEKWVKLQQETTNVFKKFKQKIQEKTHKETQDLMHDSQHPMCLFK